MGDVCVLEPDDQCAELRQAQPLRYLPFQDAALTVSRTRAFTGDHQHQPRAAGTRRAQKSQQGCVCFDLRQPVQVKLAVNPFLAACNALLHPAAKRGKRRVFSVHRCRRSCRRPRGRGFRPDGAAHRRSVIAGFTGFAQRGNRFGHGGPQHAFFRGKNTTPPAVAGAHDIRGAAWAAAPLRWTLFPWPSGQPPSQSSPAGASEAGHLWRPPCH